MYSEVSSKDNKDGSVFYFKNSSGTKIILRNALKICEETISFLEKLEPLNKLKKDDILLLTAKNALENIKANKDDRIEQITENYEKLKPDETENKQFAGIVGFGDYDPSLIVTLQIIDYKDNCYSRSCIFNKEFKYCGIYVTESEKLKVIAMSNFSN